jgi:hypothetical protein
MHWDAGHNNIIESDRTSLPTPGLSANRKLSKNGLLGSVSGILGKSSWSPTEKLSLSP